MTKALDSRTFSIGLSVRFQRLYTMAADGNLKSRIFRIPWDTLADRFKRILGFFRREPFMAESGYLERTGNPQAFEEIRNNAYLDLHRTIR